MALPKIFGYDFFISFKLGAPPEGAQSYASDLARCLRELDYAVFYSEEEAAPGEVLDSTLVRALRRSRILIVIANSGALASRWVRKEVEEFRARSPHRPVLIINVDRAIEMHGPQVDAAKWLGHEGRIWLDETAEALNSGIAAKALVERVHLVPKFIRANLLLRGVVTGVIATLAALTVFSWFKNNESHDRLVAYNLSQGRSALANGRALEAAPSLLRALREGEDTPAVRFMLARAFASADMLIAQFDATASAFSPDGTRLAVARRDGPVEIRDAADLRVLTTLEAAPHAAGALVFAPDGKTLVVQAASASSPGASGWRGDGCRRGVHGKPGVTSWDVATGKLLHTFNPPEYAHDCGETFFADDGETLGFTGWTTQRTDLYWAASSFHTSGDLMRTTVAQDRDCAWAGEGLVREGEGVDVGCPGQVVGVSDDGARVAVSPWDLQQRTLDLWHVKEGTKRTLNLGRDTFIRAAYFSFDGERLAITLQDAVEIWSLAGPTRLTRIPLESGDFDARFSPDGARIMAARGGRDAVIVDAASGERVAELTGHVGRIRSAVFSADGTRVLTGGEDAIAKLWDAWTGTLLATLEGHGGPVVEVSFSPDDRLMATLDGRGRVHLWANRSPVVPRTLRDDPARVRWWSDADFKLVSASPEGREVLLTHQDVWADDRGTLYTLWDTDTGLPKATWRASEPPSPWPAAVAAPEPPLDSPCGELLASRDDGVGVALDASSDAQVALVLSGKSCTSIRLEGHRSRITAAAISPASDRVMTGDESGEIRTWNRSTGELLSIQAAERGLRTLAFLNTDRAIAVSERNIAVVLHVSLERRSIDALRDRLSCSGLVPANTLTDLVRPDEACPAVLTEAPTFPALSAEALLTTAWARRSRVTSEARLREAASLQDQSGDLVGAGRTALALRALARRDGNAARARALAGQVKALMSTLAQAEEQKSRLTRLGEIAFNDFDDIEMARLAFATVLMASAGDRLAQLGLWETSLADDPRSASSLDNVDSSSMRHYALAWVASSVARKPTEDAAYNLWNMYAGTTIDPFFERLDFRGLRRQVERSKLPPATRRVIGEVLHELELPGNRADRVKSLLGLPEDLQTVGP